MRPALLLALLAWLSTMPGSGHAASIQTSTTAALEAQLACLSPPKPGVAINAMLRNGLLVQAGRDLTGVPLFRPRTAITVFNQALISISGQDAVRAGGRPTAATTPASLTVVLDAAPGAIAYTPHHVNGADGMATGAFSLIKANDGKPGTIITCYGE